MEPGLGGVGDHRISPPAPRVRPGGAGRPGDAAWGLPRRHPEIGAAPKAPGSRKLAIEVLEKGSTLILAQDSLAIAEHAFAKGWIGTEDALAVREEVGEQGRPDGRDAQPLAKAGKVSGPLPEAVAEVARGGIEQALAAEKGGSPPTVWVESPRNRSGS